MKTNPSTKILFIYSLLALFLFGIASSNAAGVDGACGSANGQVVPNAPTMNLCSAGTASIVTGTGPWTWSCVGSDATCTTGDSKDCTTTDSCAGKQLCTAGAWGACVKNISACGSNDFCNDQGQWCNATTRSCANKCADCPCPSDKPTCNADGSCGGSAKCDPNTQVTLVDGTCVSQCSDGTPVNQCSAASLGLQCVGVPAGAPTHVDLVAACNAGCECPGYKSCKGDNTCVNDTGLPESFSWADKNGVNWMSPIRDQGQCGSCWDFGAVAAVEVNYNIEHNTPGANIDLSEQSIISCAGLGGCQGGPPDGALSYIQKNGLVVESCSGYGGPWADSSIPCVDSCAIAKHGFAGLRTPSSRQELFKLVYEHGPVTINVNVDVGKGLQPHAVALVGWTKEGDLIVKNSWGGSGATIFSGKNLAGWYYQPYGTY